MQTLKVGDVIRDNDPRKTTRAPLRVLEIDATHARCRSRYSLMVRISLLRIHTDDKPRRSGFSVVRAG